MKARGLPPRIVIARALTATRQALDAVGADGKPVFKSVTDAIAGRDAILGRSVGQKILNCGLFYGWLYIEFIRP